MSTNPPLTEPRQPSSIEDVHQLVGQLDSNGIASLSADPNYSRPSISNPPRSLKSALKAVGRSQNSGYTTPESSEEDYDALKHDPTAVIVGGKGGGFDESEKSSGDSGILANGSRTYEDIETVAKSKPMPPRLTSIPVTLNKLKEKGRYILTADDAALREILKLGIERVNLALAVVNVTC